MKVEYIVVDWLIDKAPADKIESLKFEMKEKSDEISKNSLKQLVS